MRWPHVGVPICVLQFSKGKTNTTHVMPGPVDGYWIEILNLDTGKKNLSWMYWAWDGCQHCNRKIEKGMKRKTRLKTSGTHYFSVFLGIALLVYDDDIPGTINYDYNHARCLFSRDVSYLYNFI